MSLPHIFKFLLLPVSLPLSILYGLGAYIYKLAHFKKHKSFHYILSVGNVQAGGTGKTPLVAQLSKALSKRGVSVVLVHKSYKGSLQTPKEVSLSDKPSLVGDESLMIKSMLKGFKVFSGPDKTETIKFVEQEVKRPSLLLMDDGAQHHKVHKDFKILVWDLTKMWIDLLPFPLGRAREIWFLRDKENVSFISRGHLKYPNLFGLGEAETLTMKTTSIKTKAYDTEINDDFVLISGIGNFKQLYESVAVLARRQGVKVVECISEEDHSDFSNFEPKKNQNYVCTEKDYVKLKYRVEEKNLYVVNYDFDSGSLKRIEDWAAKIKEDYASF